MPIIKTIEKEKDRDRTSEDDWKQIEYIELLVDTIDFFAAEFTNT